MKRIISILCAAAMLFSLAACSNSTDYSNRTVTGQVTAIDGTKVTLQLGQLSEPSGSTPNGAQPDGSNSNGAPPDMQSDNSGNNGQTPPEKPNGSQPDGQAPADMPSGGKAVQNGQNTDGSNNNGTPPDIPSGNSGNNVQTPPEKPDGSQPDGQVPADMPSGGMTPPDNNSAATGFTAGEESVTLEFDGAEIKVESKAETTDGTINDITVGSVIIAKTGDNNTVKTVTVKSVGGNGAPGVFGGSDEVTQGGSANTIDTDGEYSAVTYTSDGDDENALRINGASVTLDSITVNKSAGATSNTENGDFYGVNAALLATNGATAVIKNAVVTSSAQNGNGVFSYGSGTTVNISDSKITTTADNSGGIQTTGGGTTNAVNLTVNTSGNSSAAIRSDRGGGTVNVTGGTYVSNGYNSPAVYSTADITVKGASLTANNSEALVIEGKNSITLQNCNVSGNMSDTKGSSSDENVHNVMIYQSMSGDADVGTSLFSMTGGTLTSKNGDMFYITNTSCELYLSGVNVINKSNDGYLMNICGNSASHGWGTAGKNGAQVVFTADAQTLSGNIVVDTISTLNMTLKNKSVFTGTINIVDNADGGTAMSDNAVVTVESGCTWNLTGNCTVTSLTNNGKINFNGYTITLSDGTVLK